MEQSLRGAPTAQGETMQFIPHIIDGAERQSVDEAEFDSINPYTQEAWANVSRGSAADIDAAVTSARTAFESGAWSEISVEERTAALHRLADLIDEHGDELARFDTQDIGKPIVQSRETDVPRSSSNFRFFADYARYAVDEALPFSKNHHVYTRHEPVGVVAAISPWNFPLMQATWKVAPALAFGNTVVLKPAEQSPASCHRLGLLALEAGIPPGVLNVVQGFGPGEAGEALTRHPEVDRITFTGESATGRTIAAVAAVDLKHVSFELGGKGANIVFADADIDNALDWSIRAIYTNSGQVCLAGARLYVERPIFDEFVKKFVERAQAMRVGDPMNPETEIGSISSEEHYRKVMNYVELGTTEGATMLTGGGGDGWTVTPTVFTDVRQNMRVVREEIFGPVVVIQPFDTEREAVDMANDTPYGLNAMLFTSGLSRAHRVSAQLRAGTVWVNCFFVRDLRAPFGGFKDSGLGREGGAHSREFFTEPKAVVMQL